MNPYFTQHDMWAAKENCLWIAINLLARVNLRKKRNLNFRVKKNKDAIYKPLFIHMLT